ncbi:DUF6544 family protein [Maribacter sp. 2308TA10-17]|uniref:DUF6544 family protein n=1 Tax=Maribacter sp. 2308TA10-17 TaxID=3386276 RepID=UPI0039BC5BF8
MKTYIIIFIIVFLAFLLFFGFYRFQDSVSKEKDTLFKHYGKSQIRITEDDFKDLPSPLKNYLKKVGVLGKNKNGHVTFKQQGRIKTTQEKGWTNFRAVQYMTASSPSFIWSAQSYPLFIRDKSIAGKGEVKVNLFGLKNIAISDGSKTDESALARCLGELIFYPVGFLSEDINWEVLNENSLKAKVKINGTQAEGIFYFNNEGLISRFEAKRYMNETLEGFTGIAEEYKTMNELLIPTKMRAIWNLKDGGFEYYQSTITDYILE